MSRQTILETINGMMNSYATAGEYNISQAIQILSDGSDHRIKYEIRMSSGTAIIELESKGGGFSIGHNNDYPGGYNPSDYDELFKVSTHFNGCINTTKMPEMFGLL